MNVFFKLDEEKNVVPSESYLGIDRVDATDLPNGLWVSTVFLGTTHGWDEDGQPLLFETMIFRNGSWSDLYCRRYSSWKDAKIGHEVAVLAAQFSLGSSTESVKASVPVGSLQDREKTGGVA